MSSSEFSTSDSGNARFFGAAFAGAFVVLRVVCFVAFGLGAAFFAGALAALAGAFAFCDEVSICAFPSAYVVVAHGRLGCRRLEVTASAAHVKVRLVGVHLGDGL
jgi:hypothetical protein